MKGEHLGKTGIIVMGNRQFTGHQLQGVLLVEYDVSNDTYTGVTFPKSDKFTQFFTNLGKGEFAADTPISVGVVLRTFGLRRYPYTEKPNYAFQFVLAGEDPAPLYEIAAGNYQDTQVTQPVEVQLPPVEETPVGSNVSETIPLWAKLGYASKVDWINAGRPGKN